MKINPTMTLGEFAAVISDHLKTKGITTTLTGGAVVSIYTNNEYESGDVDFISPREHAMIIAAMAELGFDRVTASSKALKHPDSPFLVEFPARSVYLGGEYQETVGEVEIAGTTVKILTPTQSCMDRILRYFCGWNDVQGLEQAEMIASEHPVSISRILKWAKVEGANPEHLKEIKKRLTAAQKGFVNKSRY